MKNLSVELLGTTSPDGGRVIDLRIKEDTFFKSLFKGNVDFLQFTKWFFENEMKIKQLDFPIDNLSKLPIAERIHYFYDEVDVNNDEIIDIMFDYRLCHCLRFASRGTDFPEIYIGKRDENHEISIFNDNEKWSYLFDIEVFFNDLKHKAIIM